MENNIYSLITHHSSLITHHSSLITHHSSLITHHTMFLDLAHTKTEVFHASKQLTMECYRITKRFPSDERFAMTQQVRRAALSVHLNIAEGSSRRSPAERRRYFEIARGSVIEVDTAMDIALQLDYCNSESIEQLGTFIVSCFKQLSGLIRSNQ